MIKLKINYFLFGVALCFSHGVGAQSYQWSCVIDTIHQEGFYKLLLTQEISSKSRREDFSDIRLMNAKNEEVPYIIQYESGAVDKKNFKEYPVESKIIEPQKMTSLVIHNSDKKSISNFSLVVKNNNAYKFSNLSGSDDKINWYFITGNYPLSQMYDEAHVAVEKIIYFPLSNYAYYKLEINDSSSAPLNILKVGNYHTAIQPEKLTRITPVSIHQNDSLKAKKTYVTIDFGVAYQINTIKLGIAGPKFYNRKAVLYSIDSVGKEAYWNERSILSISSNDNHTFSIPSLYANRYVLVINNEDNQPLKVQSVDAYQTSRYLVTLLNRDEAYRLFIGNKNATVASYDLSFFADSIPMPLPEIHIGKFIHVDRKHVTLKADDRWFKSKVWIWAVLLIVISLLAYVSYKMIGEMGKKGIE
jgi:hypothetical protein